MRDNETEWEFKSRIINEVWDKDEPKEDAKIEHKRNFVFSDDKDINNKNITEISDKVLFEQATIAMEEIYGYGCDAEIDAYFRGLKWMQKQFNKKD